MTTDPKSLRSSEALQALDLRDACRLSLIRVSNSITRLKSSTDFRKEQRNELIAVGRARGLSYAEIGYITGLGHTQLSRIVDEQLVKAKMTALPNSTSTDQVDLAHRLSTPENEKMKYDPATTNEVVSADDWKPLGRPPKS